MAWVRSCPGIAFAAVVAVAVKSGEYAEQAQQLTADITVSELKSDRQRRDALLWSFTVLGEATGQLSAELGYESFRAVAGVCAAHRRYGQVRWSPSTFGPVVTQLVTQA